MQSLPQVVESFTYRLQLEHSDLNLNYVTKTNDSNSDVYSRKTFLDFLNFHNSVTTPFTIRNVEFDTTQNDTWLNIPLDDYLKKYQSTIDIYNSNLIATSPSGNSKLLLRTKDLIYFPKFFENWSIDTIPFATTKNHIAQYNIFKNCINNCYGHKQLLSKLIQITLILNHLSANKPVELDPYVQQIVGNYYAKDVDKEFDNHKTYLDDWILFCKKLYFKAFPLDLMNHDINNKISHILEFTREYQECQFFHERFLSSAAQQALIVTLPIKKEKQRLYSMF